MIYYFYGDMVRFKNWTWPIRTEIPDSDAAPHTEMISTIETLDTAGRGGERCPLIRIRIRGSESSLRTPDPGVQIWAWNVRKKDKNLKQP